MPILPPESGDGGTDPTITTLTEGQVPQADASGKLVYSGLTIDPSTARPTFDISIEVPTGSIDFGDVITLSEGTSSLLDRDNVNGENRASVRTAFTSAGSDPVQYFKLQTEEFVLFQPDFSTTITDNPLINQAAASAQSQINALHFKTSAAMTNVRIKVTDVASGVILRHFPSKAVFNSPLIDGGGFDFILGDNEINLIEQVLSVTPGLINLGLTPFRFNAGQTVDIELVADSVSMLGDSGGNAYLATDRQIGVDITLVEFTEDGNLILDGDLTVNGTTTTIDTETLSVADSYIDLNSGYTIAAAKTGGLVVNCEATGTGDTVTAGQFTAGVASTSNPTVVTDGSDTFAQGAIIQISGNEANNGIYEVEDHTGPLLTIRGIGTVGTVEDFSKNQFVTENTSAIVTQIVACPLRVNTSGEWEQGQGSTTPITYNVIADISFVLNPSKTTGGDTPLISWETQGTNGATIRWFVGDSDPDGFATGNPGDMYILALGQNSELFQHQGSGTDNTSWARFTHTNTPIPPTPAGGSDTEVQFNNSGVLDGISGITTDGSKLLISSTIKGNGSGGDLTLEGAVSSPTGGDINLNAGSGGNNGGSLKFTTGSGNNSAGDFVFTALESPNAEGGKFTFTAGLGAPDDGSGAGGGFTFTAGDGGFDSGDGGGFNFNTGSTQGGTGASGSFIIDIGADFGGGLGSIFLAPTGGNIGIGPSITWDGTNTLLFNNNIIAGFGDNSELNIFHTGTDAAIANENVGGGLFLQNLDFAGGDLTVQNRSTIANIINKIGTDTTTTSFKVTDSSDTDLFKVFGDGKVTVSKGPLIVAGQLSLTHTSSSAITSSTGDFTVKQVATGDLILDNTSTTNDILMQLGNTTTATKFIVQDAALSNLFTVNADGSISIGIDDADDLLHVHAGDAGAVTSVSGSVITAENSGPCSISIFAPNGVERSIYFGDPSSNTNGGIIYDAAVDDGFEFRTFLSTKMVILKTGEVGIGASSPVSLLHVFSNTSTTDATNGITIEQDGTGDAALQFLLTAGQRWSMGIDNDDSDFFKISESTDLGTNTRMRIRPGGNVVIGEATFPESRLHVDSGSAGAVSANTNTVLTVEGVNPTWITILSPDNREKAIVFGGPSSNESGSIVYNDQTNALNGFMFRTNDVDNRMVITSSGDVGIGTNSPNAPFDMTGDTPGVVGGFASGALHVTSPSTDVNANAVITGHNSFGGNKQLWYLGSGSSSNDDITIINRQNGELSFGTNNTTRLTISSTGVLQAPGDLDITTGTGGVFKFNSDAFRAGLDAVEYVEIGHGGGNGFINAVGDGGLDFRFEGTTLATFTDFGHLHLMTDVDQKHTLKIITADNLNDTGIAWENSGGSFTGTIFRTDVGSNEADLVVAVGINSDIDLLTEAMRVHGATADLGKVEFANDLILKAYPNTRDDGTPINILGTDASGNLISGPNEVIHIGGNFVDTTDQTISIASTAQDITFNTNSLIDDISHTTGSATFTINTDGVYNLIIAPQLAQGSGAATVEFWVEKNGTAIVNSNVQESLAANSQSLPLLRWKERFIATDTFKIKWASNSTNTILDNITSTYGGPNIPSIMLGVTQIGS